MTKLKSQPQNSVLKINSVETLDTAFYECRASNQVDSISTVAIVNVKLSKLNLSQMQEAESNMPDEEEKKKPNLVRQLINNLAYYIVGCREVDS